MGDLKEFSMPTRLFLKGYPWRRIDPIPWAPLRMPLAQSKLALVTTAGLILPDQPEFDHKIKGGDTSFRVIPRDVSLERLIENHRSSSFDHQGIARDPNLGFPLERLRELVIEGRIGSLAEHHYSFMGSIVAPGRLRRQTAPRAARQMKEEGVDVALLVPV